MPEAPVHEDTRAILPQHQIRMPRQSLMVQSVSEPPLPQSTAHNHLRLRILPSDRRHIGVSLLWSEFIHTIGGHFSTCPLASMFFIFFRHILYAKLLLILLRSGRNLSLNTFGDEVIFLKRDAGAHFL